jgi:hypothetical protein
MIKGVNKEDRVNIKYVKVFDKDDTFLSRLTYKRANRLVARGAAVWIDPNSIQLLINNRGKLSLRIISDAEGRELVGT